MREAISVLEKKVNLYKRGRSNNWQAAIKLKNGKWERFSTGTDDEAKAKEQALKLFYGAEAKSENKLPQSTRKFRNVAKFAIDRMQTEIDGGSGKVTYKDYIRVIDNYLIPFFGKYDVANINVKLLNEYNDWRDAKMGIEIELRELTKRKKLAKKPTHAKIAKQIPKVNFKAKQSTINTHNSALNRVFDEALVHGWITESIKPKLLNKGIKSESRGAFTADEWNFICFNMWDWSQIGHRQETRELREVMFDYVAFLGHTGVRAGTEAYNLKWKNLSLIHSKKKGTVDYLAVNVDGKRGKRELIARDVIHAHLARIIEYNPRIKHKTVESAIKAKLDEYVFVNRSGERVSTDALRGAFRLFLEHHNMRVGADGKNRSLYSLRHTYATSALAAGRDIHKLAVQMGTSVEMLEKFYSKVSARMNADEHAGRTFK
ncbi:MAG: site-specific recombinase phage integrase family protein [marine bacterium B5-7]|nr:MAG: site-specific recombinase phage integrase family protein [marine bacterium B5-7]